MLRMEFDETPGGITVRLQGRFVKEFAEHARTLIGNSSEPSRFVVDLSDVTYVDAVGEEVLIWLKEMGIRFSANCPYCLDVCDRLDLPIADQGSRRRRKTEQPRPLRRNEDGVPERPTSSLSTFSFFEPA